MRARWWPALALAVLAVLALTAGCEGNDAEPAGPGGRLRVVASTAIIADLAAQIAGDDAEVVTVIPAGADAHSFQAAPDIVRRIAEADVVVVNGYNLEEATLDVILENRRDAALLVVASSGVDVLGGEGRVPEGAADLASAEGDPHIWLSVRNAMVYVANIADALVAADPDHATDYRAREEAYLAELQALDEELRAAVAEIPRERRLLVVFHDAFRYFADAYGLELVAAVLPSSPSQQASAGRIAEVIELVETRGVPAIYREPQFASEALDAIADETGARVLALYSGALTDGIDSYVELMRANAAALLDGLAE
jgi:ABC-type Zn uptake system ZnuABC Zn-binding protein ZnuA